MSKTWSEHTEEERLAAGAKITAVYEKHGHPKWLQNLTQMETIVIKLNTGETSVRPSVLTI
jgi:hypothetical protein